MAQRILDTGNKIALQNPQPRVESNWFDMSFDNKLSCNMGKLIPVYVEDCLPGDVMKVAVQNLVRFAPMLAPVMHQIIVRTEAFFVPYRLLWENYSNWIMPETEDAVPPVPPFFNITAQGGVKPGSLSDFLGLPLVDGAAPTPGALQVSALFHAAYFKIYADWYCDEDLNGAYLDYGRKPFLQDGFNQPLFDYANANVLLERNYDKDYFTSAKPWPQKGPAVVIPFSLSGQIDGTVTGDISQKQPFSTAPVPKMFRPDGQAFSGDGHLGLTDPNAVESGIGEQSVPNYSLGIDPAGAWEVKDLPLSAQVTSLLNSSTINDLRVASAMQRWLEADSFGTRYIEGLYNHFGVRSSDARLQRSEYLGSTSQTLTISEVLQMSATINNSTPQGNMAGHGISAAHHSGYRDCRVEEWGSYMVLMSIMPATGYSQGVPARFTKFDRMDVAWPELANIGYQPIKNQEVYFDVTNTDGTLNQGTFGYLPRYTEYKMRYNEMHGQFRTSMDYWTLNRLFPHLPALGSGFILCNSVDTERIFADTSDVDDHIYCHLFFNIRMNRPLPKLAMPRLM